MAKDMPCGMYIRRRKENNFIKEYPTPVSGICIEWLSHLEEELGITIEHAKNYGEATLTERNLKVDGYHRLVNSDRALSM